MTTPYYSDDTVTVHHGDCLDVLRTLPDCSVDSVVTDPPYGLEFMGKDWDAPWQKGAGVGEHNAGFSPGAPAVPGVRGAIKSLPSYTGSTNPTCRNCGGTRNGQDRESRRACRCERPEFPNTTLPRMRAFQAWCEQWAAECLRVLKPGGHMLAFGGTRTWHRLACAVEDAGFEIRDTVASLGGGDSAGLLWVHAQGFPKSKNVSVDPQFCQCDLGECGYGDGNLLGVRQGVSDAPGVAQAGQVPDMLQAVQRQGAGSGVGDARTQGPGGMDPGDSGLLPAEDVRGAEPGVEGRGHLQAAQGQLHRPEVRALPDGPSGDGPLGRVRDGAPAGDGAVDRSPAAAVRGGQPHQPRAEGQSTGESGAVPVERGPQAWRGWPLCGRCGKPALPPGLGTALKPAFEPIVVARKPLAGTVAQTVLAHGTGALNIAGTRVAGPKGVPASPRRAAQGPAYGELGNDPGTGSGWNPNVGRWPSNVVLTHAPDCEHEDDGGCAEGCPIAELDAQSGTLTSGANPTRRGTDKLRDAYGDFKGQEDCTPARGADTGGASRFFPAFRYEAKADAAERPRAGDTAHPTVKPLALMRWLVRLVTPPGGLVLDPFAGSGTTAEACLIEGFRCVTIEREADYLPLIVHRITRRTNPVAHLTAQAERGEDVDLGLFGLLDDLGGVA